MTDPLFEPLQIGALTLPHRIVMAPLTRCRASAGRVPNRMMADYYAQRASFGLILSEATSVCPQGVGYPSVPALGPWLKQEFGGAFIANEGFTADSAREAVAAGTVDAVAFGKAAIANPDLVERIRAGTAWNEPDPDTFYGGDAGGYLDYPVLQPTT